jgi:hypothetical protein
MSLCQSKDCRGYNVTSTSVSINFIDVDLYKSYKNRSIKKLIFTSTKVCNCIVFNIAFRQFLKQQRTDSGQLHNREQTPDS